MRILTKDVFAGAYLMSHGAALEELLVDTTAGRPSGTFVFEGDEDLEAHHKLYCLGHATASVKSIREGVHLLRSRLAGGRAPRSDPRFFYTPDPSDPKQETSSCSTSRT